MSWCLSITEEQFDEFYPSMKEYKYIFYRDFKTDEEFTNVYLPSKLWRLNNIYTIVNKHGDAVPFVMSWAQHKVYSAYLKHPRLIILKSRQQGISTLWLMLFFDDAVFSDNYNIGLMAQGADEASTLLERVKFAWDKLDDSIKSFLEIANDKDNAKAFSFTNGSTIFIRTSFRSATLQRLHISELGKIANKNPDKAKETNTGTLQTLGRTAGLAIESTAEGDNMFKTKWDIAYEHVGPYGYKDLLAVFLSWTDDPDCVSDKEEVLTPTHKEYFADIEVAIKKRLTKEQKWFWIMQERELADSDDSDIYQEYPATPEEAFSAVRVGTYYSSSIKEHIIKKKRFNLVGLYDSNLDVDVVMDLGMNDEFVLGFWQRYREEDRLIHTYHNSGEGLEHYVNYMYDRPYNIGRVICPHDIRVKELSTGQSRLHALRKLGVRRIRVLPRLSINAGIEAVRVLIKNLWIDEEAEYGYKGLCNYSKEWDGVRGVWKDKPLHNEWSHPADMIRYRAVSLRLYKGADVERRQASNRQRKRNQSNVVDGICL